jgi:hypothetical protein
VAVNFEIPSRRVKVGKDGFFDVRGLNTEDLTHLTVHYLDDLKAAVAKYGRAGGAIPKDKMAEVLLDIAKDFPSMSSEIISRCADAPEDQAIAERAQGHYRTHGRGRRGRVKKLPRGSGRHAGGKRHKARPAGDAVEEYYRGCRENVALLTAHGHPYAAFYPLGKLGNETLLFASIQRNEMAFRASVDQTVGSAVFSGGKKALNALKKLLRELTDE